MPAGNVSNFHVLQTGFPMILSLPILPIVLWAAVTLQSGFSSPDFVTPYGSGAFQNVVVWYVGQSKEVAYSIADLSGLDNYTIALWQQATDGGAATLGPVVNSKLASKKPLIDSGGFRNT